MIVLTRTRLISPSKLYWASICPLRYMLETERKGDSSVPAPPVAAIGTAVHSLIEGLTPVGLDGQELKRAIAFKVGVELKRAANRNQVLQYLLQRFGEGSVFTNNQLLSSIRLVRKAQFALGTQARAVKPTPVPIVSSKSEAESEVFSDRYGIQGSIDRVTYYSDGTVEIDDFKTGRVLDEDGALKPQYFYQMCCYGLLVQESRQVSEIQLRVIGPNDDWQSNFTSNMQSTVQSVLQEIKKILPLDTPIKAASLARPGSHCTSCSQRANCDIFADSIWSDGYNFDVGGRLCDVSGVIDRIEELGQGLACMILRTSSGRFCKISNIPLPMIGESLAVNDDVICYSALNITSTVPSGGPSNLEVVNLNEPGRSGFGFFIRHHT